MTTGKTTALARWTFADKVMSLLFNILSAAAAPKSLQLCPILCNPVSSSPPASPVPGILQARTLGWVSITMTKTNGVPKVHLVKPMFFLVVMYGCESWTIKKTECQRIGAFELWCWRKLLKFPWTARRSNYSILKEISPE